jgi:HSP20 family protein
VPGIGDGEEVREIEGERIPGPADVASRDDRDDPFDDFFREIERMVDGMVGDGGDPAGLGSDTHVDVHETGDEIRVVADLPGVSKEQLALKCDGENLMISADTPHRQFDERIRLPAPVDETSGSATFNNGVLEVRLAKTGDSANISLE